MENAHDVRPDADGPAAGRGPPAPAPEARLEGEGRPSEIGRLLPQVDRLLLHSGDLTYPNISNTALKAVVLFLDRSVRIVSWLHDHRGLHVHRSGGGSPAADDA